MDEARLALRAWRMLVAIRRPMVALGLAPLVDLWPLAILVPLVVVKNGLLAELYGWDDVHKHGR